MFTQLTESNLILSLLVLTGFIISIYAYLKTLATGRSVKIEWHLFGMKLSVNVNNRQEKIKCVTEEE